MLGATRPALAPALATLLVLTAAPSGRAAGTSAGDPPVVQDTLTATVRYVHAEQGGIEVITGFHMALKLTYIRVEEATRIERQGETLRLEELEPGDLVRVSYRETDEGIVAQRIEVIRQREGGKR